MAGQMAVVLIVVVGVKGVAVAVAAAALTVVVVVPLTVLPAPVVVVTVAVCDNVDGGVVGAHTEDVVVTRIMTQAAMGAVMVAVIDVAVVAMADVVGERLTPVLMLTVRIPVRASESKVAIAAALAAPSSHDEHAQGVHRVGRAVGGVSRRRGREVAVTKMLPWMQRTQGSWGQSGRGNQSAHARGGREVAAVDKGACRSPT